ncbi:MAG: hypothetical protein IJV26_08630 [Lachnospiraceae bacterium]|nr:hypothetical protein [Lachnospiraceae bacterium]
MKEMKESLLAYASDLAAQYGLSIRSLTQDYFPETRNHDEAVDCVLQQAQALNLNIISMDKIWRASEDFGYYPTSREDSRLYKPLQAVR